MVSTSEAAAAGVLQRYARSPRQAVRMSRELIASVIEVDLDIEGIDVSWGQAVALATGFPVVRVRQIAQSARSTLMRARTGRHAGLRTARNGVMIEANADLGDGERELSYLVDAVAGGADPAVTLHTVSGSLICHGLPWLFVPYVSVEVYRGALEMTRSTGDGDELVAILLSGLDDRSWAR